METVAVIALQPNMELAEDVVDYQGKIIMRKNTVLDIHMIKKIQAHSIMTASIKEAEDYVPTYFEKLKVSKTFKQFADIYAANFAAWKVSVDSFIYKKVPMNNSDLLKLTDNIISPFARQKSTIIDMLYVLQHDETDMTYAHCLNVTLLCNTLGYWLRFNEEQLNTLILCGFYYDIGKFLLPNDIIWKKGKLNNLEFDLVKTHAFHGYHIIRDLDINDHVKRAALMHHERCDGSGYPQKLSLADIDPFAKMIAILDSYEAMTSFRSYREPMCPFKVISIFENEGLQKYDAGYIMTFLERMVEEYMNKQVRLSDGREGVVVFINKQKLSRPMVHCGGNDYVDLSQNKSLSIEALL